MKAGKFRALTNFNANRDPAFPDIPTAKEQGYAVYGNPFVGMAIAKGVPQNAMKVLRAALKKVANSSGFKSKAVKTGTAITYLPADKFGAVWARDWKNYEPILRKK